MINRDERRFLVADHNRDHKLTKDEFGDFIHPEDVRHMKDIVIEVCACVLRCIVCNALRCVCVRASVCLYMHGRISCVYVCAHVYVGVCVFVSRSKY